MHPDDLLRPWLEPLLDELPELSLVDVHTHVGSNDPDGFRSSPEDLLTALERVRARGLVFPMHEPAGYPPANDRVLAAAESSGGRLVPLCRVDPSRDSVAEAERCLDAGARGVKLHPRAEGFALSDPAVTALVTMTAERQVPVLIHAGRGIPALGRDALALCERFPRARLILAHAAISDLSWIWRQAPEQPNLFFDTTWWNPVDLLALLALVPPGQVLYGSDAPYGTPLQAAILTLRCALQAGLSARQLRSVMGEQIVRLVDGQEPLDGGPAVGTERLSCDILLDRVYAFLSMATGRLLHGEDAEQELSLARLACEVGEDAPQAPVCRSIVTLLDRHARYAGDHPPDSPQGTAVHLIVTAAGLAKSPDPRLPAVPEEVSVGERSA